MSGILPYYYHTAKRTNSVITPEFNYLENRHPDYTIFLITTNPYKAEIWAVIELKSKNGDSWAKLLEQLWDQADSAKMSNGKLWAIGQKGLEICIFEFDVSKFKEQKPDYYTNFNPLNLQ